MLAQSPSLAPTPRFCVRHTIAFDSRTIRRSIADQPSRGLDEIATESHDSQCTYWIAGSRPGACSGFVIMT
ncbi:MAG: hypothetical protein ACRECQ_14495, partial [Burkholderiaceae bacterium]